MERQLKTGTIDYCYCPPSRLLEVIDDYKQRAGFLHTVVTAGQSVRWPRRFNRFAIVWVRRQLREYKIGLQIVEILKKEP